MRERRRPWRPTGVVLLCASAGLGASAAEPGSGRPAPGGTEVLSRLPLAFVENQGQWDTPARFLARRRGMAARIEREGLALRLTRRDGDDLVEGVVVRLLFEGALGTVAPEGEGKQPGTYNFILGNDPSKWRTEVPAYASVLYRGLQQGVDLRVREEKGRLEYDLILAPGADLDRVVVRCEGTEGIEVEPDGSLAMQTALGPIRQSRPVSWQSLAGGGRRPIEARFRKLGSDRYGIEASDRDPSLPLVIDPGILYSTILGGALDDYPQALAVDATGNAVVAGDTDSLDFPTTPGAFDTTWGPWDDVFVTRLPLSGGPPVYSTFLGGLGTDHGFGLALDASGGAVLTGRTSSPDFPVTPGAFDTTISNDDVFVLRFPPAGGAPTYSTFLGGSGPDFGEAIALDATGAALVAGITYSPDFPLTPGAFDTTLGVPNGFDGFVTRLPLTGGSPSTSSFVGGPGPDWMAAVAFDPSGAAVATGYTRGPNFPTTPGAFDTTWGGYEEEDVFVVRIPFAVGLPAYSTLLGGVGYDHGEAIAVDAAGNAVLAGTTASLDFPSTPGAFDPTINSIFDGFVTQLPLTGSPPIYSTFLGGTWDDNAWTLALDPTGAVVVAGFTQSPDFPTTQGALDTTVSGFAGDGFVVRLRLTGEPPSYSTLLGGIYSERVLALALDATVAATVLGETRSPDFPTTPGAFDTTVNPDPGPNYNGIPKDAFVARLDLLPGGISAYGASTPGCAGPLAIGATSFPGVGNTSFGITCTGAPPNSVGLVGLSAAPLPSGVLGLGVQVWIDPSATSLYGLLPATSDSVGWAVVPLPVPGIPGLAGLQAFAQFLWADACGPASFSASNALGVTVQP